VLLSSRAALAATLALVATLSMLQTGGVSFVAAGSNSASSSTRTATNQTSISTITSNATESVFEASPSSQSIPAGGYARFNINISQPTTTNVLLVARDIPYHSIAIFTPEVGVASPQFYSTLTVATSADTPAGKYNVTIVALLNDHEDMRIVNLQIMSNITTGRTSTTVSAASGLSLSVDTNQHFYQPNSSVIVRGHVTDISGIAAANAKVSVQVDDPKGVEVLLVNNLMTDTDGVFKTAFKLGVNATFGTYTVFVSSTKSAYTPAMTHMTFVVGSSSTPSITITQIYVTDTTGKPTGVFSIGQTILLWVVVQDDGAPLQGVIWVQVLDPTGSPRTIQLQISTLNTGASVKVAFGFTATSNLPLGIYTANALVSDKLISQGGMFLASANTQFALTE
jgi:5-hydroxyisourate hydrolase-like protein (transthyretin family)